MIQKRNGRQEVLDITKIQQHVISATETLSNMHVEYTEMIKGNHKNKSKQLLHKIRMEHILRGKLKQKLIELIKLLTTKIQINNTIPTIITFLKNIFGNNNSTESDNNK